jgi:hypothetical protein
VSRRPSPLNPRFRALGPLAGFEIGIGLPARIGKPLTEANNQVRGSFAGRYKVPKGQRMNPRVNFSFVGPLHAGSSKFTFTAADGLKGEIELIRLPGKQDAIEVVWYSERDKLTFDDIFFRVP